MDLSAKMNFTDTELEVNKRITSVILIFIRSNVKFSFLNHFGF